MDLEIRIGATPPVPGRLPIMPLRYRLQDAYRAAHGFVGDTDERRAGDRNDLGAVLCAALGLCWAGPPLDCPTFRECGRDVVEYGEGVWDALARLGYRQADVFEAGSSARRAVWDSIPKDEEIEEAADFSSAPAATSTGSTSTSA